MPSSSPFILVIWHLPPVSRGEKCTRSEGGNDIKAPKLLHAHVPCMYQWEMCTCQEEIIPWGQKPCNYQLPLFSLLSRKIPQQLCSPSWQMKNFFYCLLSLLVSISFNYCLPIMPFIQLSATFPAKSFKMQWHARKTMSANNELITATYSFSALQSIFFRVSLPEKCFRLPFCPSVSLFVPAWARPQRLHILGANNGGIS